MSASNSQRVDDVQIAALIAKHTDKDGFANTDDMQQFAADLLRLSGPADRDAVLEEARLAYEGHIHVAEEGNNDYCRQCGGNFRDEIHFRMGETRKSRIAALYATDSDGK